MLTTTPVEPQRARFTKDNVIIKDHYFYNGNEFKWNKPSQITDKYYPYYHKQQQEHKERIENLKAQEGYDNDAVEQARRQYIIKMKQKTKTLYHDRVKERLLIQNKSNQEVKSMPNIVIKNVESETFDVIAKRLVASKHLRSDDISWNHMHKATKKYVDQFLTPVSLRGEDNMIQYFKKKLGEEKVKEHNQIEQRAITHKAIRNIFLAKHEENYEKESKINYPSRPNLEDKASRAAKSSMPSIQVLDCESPRGSSKNSLPSISPSYPSLTSTDGEFKLKFMSSVPNLDKKNMSYNSMNLDKLAEPRKSPNKDYTMDYTELNGMLIKNMDEKVFYSGNPFFETFANKNEFFNETLQKNREGNKQGQKSDAPLSEQPSILSRANSNVKPVSYAKKRNISYRMTPDYKSEKKLVTINEREEVFDGIEAFENKIPHAKPVGYGNSQLDELVKVPRRVAKNF